MKRSGIAIIVIVAGVAILLAFSTALYLEAHPEIGSDYVPPINQVLQMHAEAPGSSGSLAWYNVTLTLNRSVPLADFILILYNPQHVPEIPPPNLTLTLVNGLLALAEYNFSSQTWTPGAPQSLETGDWFEIQVTNHNLESDQLVVGGQRDYVGASAVLLP